MDRIPYRLSPNIIGQISHDRFRRTPDHDPTEGGILRRVYFPVHQPGRHVQEVSRTYGDSMLSSLAQPHIRFAFKNIHNSLLCARMMYPGLCARFDKKCPSPKSGVDTQFGANCCKSQRARSAAVKPNRALVFESIRYAVGADWLWLKSMRGVE